MANATITVKEADGVTETDVIVLDVGRQAAAASKSVALATEDKAVLDAMATSLAAMDDVNANGRAAAASSAPVVLSTEDLAAVNGIAPMKFVDVTLTLDTSAYGSGDLLADAQVVAACVKADDALGILQSVALIDEDDQKAALTLFFASASNTWGSENSAPSISDANAREYLGHVDIAVADYKDLGGVSVASKQGLGMVVKPATGTDDIYVAAVNGTGTPTYTASGLRLRLGFI